MSATISSRLPDGMSADVISKQNAVNAPAWRPTSRPFTRTVAFTDEDGVKASELEAEFAELNGWEAESDAAQLLNGLGVDTEYHYKMMKMY